ncbi:hypothetical protein DSC45_33320 [Streptomyces sp. YIM 130001]|uniref:hypothetical protein n=1 Tax=Streptomyces sp. YIM 130001 TaxID=2259644 RepID=UPI000EEE8716|nr:hypothetical protein [Streptomyces sp. YIM 130001]RII08599.1 hypothetical protein DSC45_33320 [Streptomyces sp. YIM 130001]
MTKRLIRAVVGVSFIAAAALGVVGQLEDPSWDFAPATIAAAAGDPQTELVPAAVPDPSWDSAPAGVNT